MTRRARFAALALALVAPVSVQAEALQPLSQQGRWLTDSAGRVVLLHGGNVALPGAGGANGGSAAWTERTPARMAAQGFNAVRLVIFLSDLMPRPGQVDRAYLDRVAHIVAAYRMAGIRTLIDFHQDEYSASVGVRGMPDWAVFTDGHSRLPGLAFPMGYFKDPAVQHAFDNFWANHPVPGTGKGVQDLYIAALTALAMHLRDEPGVLGIDVMNEPATGSLCARPDEMAERRCLDLEQRLLAPFYARASRAIAAAAPRMLVFVEPFMLQGATATAIATPVAAPAGSRGISFHNYGPVSATRDAINDAVLAHAVAVHAAPLNTEWGFDNDPAVITAQADAFDARLIPWLAWPRGAFEALVDPALSDPANGDRAALLRAYARPFAQAVAGTPTAMGFDARDGTMRLAYATRLPNGRRADLGLDTVVAIPQVNYPQGYRVEVRGARVVSAPGAAHLRLRNRTGAVAVTVVVHRVGVLAPVAAEAAAVSDPGLAGLPPIPAGPLSRRSLLGHVVATPGGRAALDAVVPGLLVGVSQLHGWQAMTLLDVQQIAGGALDERRLAAVDAALGRIAVVPGPVGAKPAARLGIDSLTSDLLADPRAMAILAREAPGLAGSAQQALYPQTRLRDLQPLIPEILTREVLARIAAALAALP
jgi:endoglycosylceramidase